MEEPTEKVMNNCLNVATFDTLGEGASMQSQQEAIQFNEQPENSPSTSQRPNTSRLRLVSSKIYSVRSSQAAQAIAHQPTTVHLPDGQQEELHQRLLASNSLEEELRAMEQRLAQLEQQAIDLKTATVLTIRRLNELRGGEKETAHRCPHPRCVYIFKFRNDLDRHQKVHSDKHHCRVCQMCFPSPSHLKNHLRTHTVGGDANKATTVIEVAESEEEDATESEDKEIDNESEDDIEVIEDVIIDSGDIEIDEDSDVIEIIEDVGEDEVIVDGGKTTRKNEAGVHLKIHFIKCQYCQKWFTSSADLQAHLRIHAKDERPFVCDWIGCGQRYKRESTLNEHIKSKHSDEFDLDDDAGLEGDVQLEQQTVCELENVEETNENRETSEANGNDVNEQRLRDSIGTPESGSGGDLEVPEDGDAALFNETGEEIDLDEGKSATEAGPSRTDHRFRCQHPGCASSFKHKYNLTQHRNVHTNKFQCPECQKCFINTYELKRHEPVHSDDQPLACDWPGCSRTFKRKYQLKQHREWVHSNERRFQCSKEGCDKTFKTKRILGVHLKNFHSSLGPFNCQVQGCGGRFKTTSHLKNHMNTHCEVRMFRCHFKDCGKTFKSRQVLNNHMNLVHSDERPFKCTENGCNKTFKKLFILNQHLKTHSTDRPFRCQEEGCGKSFTTKQTLQKNLASHLADRPFPCQVDRCDKRFKTKYNLNSHLNQVHCDGRPFKCTENGCNKMFKTNSCLKQHLKFHLPIRPFQCSEDGCGKSFVTKQTLQKHLTSHSSDRPFPCQVEGCDKRSKTKEYLKSHMNHVHPEVRKF